MEEPSIQLLKAMYYHLHLQLQFKLMNSTSCMTPSVTWDVLNEK